MKKNIPQLINASLKLISIHQALTKNKLILFITSTPSYSLVLSEAFPTKSIQSITGANHHEYQKNLQSLRFGEIDILILGIEQLVNPTKLDMILSIIPSRLGFVMIDHVQQLSLYNHDTKAEYFSLKNLYQTLNTATWYLFSHAVSTLDKQMIEETFGEIIDSYTAPSEISLDYYPINKNQQLQVLYEQAQQYNVLIVSHNYLQAEMTAYKLNELIPTGVIHRKVEESSKVAITKKWQQGSLHSLVSTSDTLLPYPYPSVDCILWIETPSSRYQLYEWHNRFNAKKSIVVGSVLLNSFNQSTIHHFPYDDSLTTIMNVIASHPLGITMREMEHYLNMESYTFEKALKGLRAQRATKKLQSKYVVDWPWHLNQELTKNIQQVKLNQHQNLQKVLAGHTQEASIITNEHVASIYQKVPLPLRPKVLFPIGFYPKSLIPNSLLSKTGFVFEEPYEDIENRSFDIIQLLKENNINFAELSIAVLALKYDATYTLANYISNKLELPLVEVLSEFDSSILEANLNPFHKMSVITNQIKLLNTNQLKTTTVVVADHADHSWQMAVVAYELLSQSMCKRVIVVFNQP